MDNDLDEKRPLIEDEKNRKNSYTQGSFSQNKKTQIGQSIVIVGSGPAGLTAAMSYIENYKRLNSNNLSSEYPVILIEKRKEREIKFRKQTVTLNLDTRQSLIEMVDKFEILDKNDIEFLESLKSSIQIEIGKIQSFILRRINYINNFPNFEMITDLSIPIETPYQIGISRTNSGLEYCFWDPNDLKEIKSYVPLDNLRSILGFKSDENIPSLDELLIHEEYKRKIILAGFAYCVKEEGDIFGYTGITDPNYNNPSKSAWLLGDMTIPSCNLIIQNEIHIDELIPVVGESVVEKIKMDKLYRLSMDLRQYPQIKDIVVKNDPQLFVKCYYESSVSSIDFENGHIIIDHKGSQKKILFKHIILADGASAPTLALLPNEANIKRIMPKELEFYEKSCHVSAHLRISRKDGKAIPFSEPEFLFDIFEGNLYYIRFDMKSISESKSKLIKLGLVGEIPEEIHRLSLQNDSSLELLDKEIKKITDNISLVDSAKTQALEYLKLVREETIKIKQNTLLAYVKKYIADYFKIYEDDLDCQIVPSNNKDPEIKAAKNRLKINSFLHHNRKANVGAKMIQGHGCFLLGDAYCTPLYVIGHGMNDAITMGEAIGEIARDSFIADFNIDIFIEKYNILIERKAISALNSMKNIQFYRNLKIVNLVTSTQWGRQFLVSLLQKNQDLRIREYKKVTCAIQEYIKHTHQLCEKSTNKEGQARLKLLRESQGIMAEFKDELENTISKNPVVSSYSSHVTDVQLLANRGIYGTTSRYNPNNLSSSSEYKDDALKMSGKRH